jgi:hypothetical protein
MIPHVFFPRNSESCSKFGAAPCLSVFALSYWESSGNLLEECQALKTIGLLRACAKFDLSSIQFTDILSRFEALKLEDSSIDPFVLFIENQNCCLQFSRTLGPQVKENKYVLIQAFEIQAPPKDVVRHPFLFGQFPRAMIRVPLSALDVNLARQLADLLSEPLEAVQDLNHSNADSRFIFDWLLSVLTAFSPHHVVTQPINCVAIVKKIRDTVTICGGQPWRRAPAWMALRALLHTSLVNELGSDVGRLVYKAAMVKFMSRFLVLPESSQSKPFKCRLNVFKLTF